MVQLHQQDNRQVDQVGLQQDLPLGQLHLPLDLPLLHLDLNNHPLNLLQEIFRNHLKAQSLLLLEQLLPSRLNLLDSPTSSQLRQIQT